MVKSSNIALCPTVVSVHNVSGGKMPSGETNKDAPSATTGLAHTMGFNECEQIADMMEIVENQSLSDLHCDCIIQDDGYSIQQIQEISCRSGGWTIRVGVFGRPVS